MLNLLKNADLIGPKAQFYITNNTIHQTTLGGILTILVCIFSGLCFIGFGLDIFQKVKPDTIFSKELIKSPTIAKKDLFYLIAPMFPGGKKIPEVERKLNFTFTLADSDGSRSISTNYTNIPMVPCSETENFQNNLYNVTSNFMTQASSYVCIPDSFTRNLEGIFGSSKFTIFEFFV